MIPKPPSTYLPVLVVIPAVLFLAVSPATGTVNLLTANDHGVTVEYHPEPLRPVDADQGIIRLALKGGDHIFSPGMPELPVYIVTVAVPPGSNPVVHFQTRETGEVWKGSLPVFNPRDDDADSFRDYSIPVPGEVIGKVEMRSLAGMKVLRIPVYPVRYDDNPPMVELAKRVVFRVDFGPYVTDPNSRPVKLSRAARLVVVNAEQASGWGRYATSSFVTESWPLEGSLYRFEVNEENIYKVSFQDLRNWGVDLPSGGVTSSHIKIFGNGGGELSLDPGDTAVFGLRESALFMNDGGDDNFSAGDWFLFYGQGAGEWVKDNVGWKFAVNHYSNSNYYWFKIDPNGGGKRMDRFTEDILHDTTVTTGISRYYLEPEKFIFHPGGISGSGREWYGYTFDGASRISYTFNLPAPDVNLPANLRVRIIKTLRDPHIDVFLNGESLGSYYPGFAHLTSSRLFADIQSKLNDDYNSLTLEQNRSEALAHFDWLDLSYHCRLDRARIFESLNFNGSIRYEISEMDEPWIFDITQHNDVKLERASDFTIAQTQSTPRRFILASNEDFASVNSPFEEYFRPDVDLPDGLGSNQNDVDLLLITPDNYWDAVEPLLDSYTRREPSLDAKRVRLSEIYNRFSGGLRDPGAIRNMLMFANEYWSDPPDYVVLCGDGDYNYRDINRTKTENFLPPYENGMLCTDDWFVDFTPYSDDQNSYPLPEIPIGRLTAGNVYEMRAIVEKIVNYTDDPEFGHWRSRVTLVADDEFGEGWNSEDEHIRYTELLSESCIPSFFERDKIYLTEYERQWGREKPGAADDLIESINTGTLLVNYMGHGNSTLWAHEHVFVLSRDMNRIEPSRRLPVYLAFTCDWAYWDDPAQQSFPEQLLAAAGRGAIGIIASTRLTGGGPNYNLASNFYCNLFIEPDGMTLAEALLLGKHQYRSSPINSASYHLLGDPAMFIGAPRMRGSIDTLTEYPLIPLALSTVTGEVHDDLGQVDVSFTGEVEFLALDTKVERHHVVYRPDSNPINIYYDLSGPTVYRVLLSIK